MDPLNRRGHPVLSGLLYLFCPAAAGWWTAGADPLAPFDPLWEAHALREKGQTLREVLEMWGFGELMGYAKKYIEQISAFRDQQQHKHIRAPELLPTFAAGRMPISNRHGFEDAFQGIDGLVNFYRFIRAWGFTSQDWQAELNFNAFPAIRQIKVVSNIYVDDPVSFGAWSLTSQNKTITGYLSSLSAKEPSLFTEVIHFSTPQGDFRPVPEVYQLFEDGNALRIRPVFGMDTLKKIFTRLSDLIHPERAVPVNLFQTPSLCSRCGFQSLCWEIHESGSRQPTRLAMRILNT